MARSKSSAPVSRGWQLARILWRPQHRGPVLATAVVLAAIGGAVAAWQRWGDGATSSPDYVVTPDKIRLTPRPAWIHTDVKAEVIRAANLSRLDLRDRGLVEEVARAFALHAWIAKVERVQKRFPAQVTVAVAYRKPVAAVELTSGGQPGLLFVDEGSVLLPSADFAQRQVGQFLRIGGISSTPAGGYGSPWGDERLAGAARIAAAFGERFRQAELARILPAEHDGHIVYELRTHGDTRVLWGSAPGRESTSEPSAEQKITILLGHVAAKGPLDRPGGERLIDLGKLAAGTPRTASGADESRR